MLVPIWQELVFRYLPYRFIYLPIGKFWEVGLLSNIVFATLHWYIGKWFTIWAFLWGIILWWVMGRYGLIPAILLHSLVNVVDLRFGIRKLFRNKHGAEINGGL